MFPYSYRNTSGSLGEREIEVYFKRNFEFSQTSTSVSITYGNTGENVFYFFYKITRRKLKRGNSLLYRSVNSPYCSWWCEPVFMSQLKGNCHELRMHLSKFVCGKTCQVFWPLFVHGICSFIAAKGPSYAGGSALHRCRLESNLKGSCWFLRLKVNFQNYFANNS